MYGQRSLFLAPILLFCETTYSYNLKKDKEK